MRMTKIHMKRWSRPVVLVGGFILGSVLSAYIAASANEPVPLPAAVETVQADPVPADTENLFKTGFDADEEKPKTVAEKFAGMVISGVAQDADGKAIYVQLGNESEQWNLDTLRAAGYVVRMVNACEVLIMNQDRTETARVHTSYCGPEKPPVTPPRMTEAERYQWKLEQVRAVERLSRND